MRIRHLTEARLIVPHNDSMGHHKPNTLDEVRLSLLDHFGGYTEIEGRGAFASGVGVIEEPISIFDIDTGTSDQATNALLKIATFVFNSFQQESVYLRHATGHVEYVKTQQQEK